jgi:carbamoyltransferase
MRRRVLGISAFYHDSAAALVEGGHIVAAAQQERFTRKKHDAGFPKQAIEFCLAEAGCRLSNLDLVVFYDKPFLKFERLLETYVALAPRGFTSFRTAMPVWLAQKLFQKNALLKALDQIDPEFEERRLLFTEHHLSHAASAFFASPFEEAATLTMDGVGEWATTSIGIGRNNRLELHREIHFPHSLGLLYSAFTFYTGFKVNSGEYKLMGLAPYGDPKFASTIRDNLIHLHEDGSFQLDLSYFDYCTGLRMTNDKFARLFGEPAREPESEPLTQFHMDLAASIQAVLEEAVLRLARFAKKSTGQRHLALAGGVALNCVANGKIQREGMFDKIWVQPAAGDAGGALGAALAGVYLFDGTPRTVDEGADLMQGAYLGPEFSQEDTEQRLSAAGAKFEVLTEDAVIAYTAGALAEQKAVGWMQGRMEFGPRALGDRSILGDPRSPTMQKMLNLKVKYRESFRPFAPSVLYEDMNEWFELDTDSPYMLLVAPLRERHRLPMAEKEQTLFGIDKLNVARSSIPAVTHIDYSARVQTVHANTNPRFHALISRFKQLTGCGILVNTSFNVRGEPIVCTPEDAFRCFMGTEIDVLVAGNCVLKKEEQDRALKRDYKSAFHPD